MDLLILNFENIDDFLSKFQSIQITETDLNLINDCKKQQNFFILSLLLLFDLEKNNKLDLINLYFAYCDIILFNILVFKYHIKETFEDFQNFFYLILIKYKIIKI